MPIGNNKPARTQALHGYRSKRDFTATPEPRGAAANAPAPRSSKGKTLQFVVQKHAARQLHYDFRLELGGTLRSWAVPKGPSLDPRQKRMAVQVEDHPLDYAGFEGRIPAGQYGAGQVIVWDRGTWQPEDGDADAALRAGMLKFRLDGGKLQGRWMLVRIKSRQDERQPPWLLIKERDDAARPHDQYDVLQALPDSVISGARIEAGKPPKDNATATKVPKTTTAAPRHAPQAAAPLPAAARKAELPQTIEPALATLVQQPPARGDWRYEVKFDGYRMLARLHDGQVRLQTRNGHDWSDRVPALVHALRALDSGVIASAWLDGELVMPGEHGAPDFQALQNAFDGSGRALQAALYYVFDLPFYAGHDLRKVPLDERRALLQQVLLAAGAPPMVRMSETFDGVAPQALLDSARQLHLEGVIGKRASSPYPVGRSADWIKLKIAKRQEFVIGGYTAPRGSRIGLGSLLLGVYEADDADEAKAGKQARVLRYAGNVGTGFDDAGLARLHAQLAALARHTPPFVDPPSARGVQWVEPRLVAEVAFGAWTQDHRIRHAVFKGLRQDKPARDIGREIAVPPGALEAARTTHATRKSMTATTTSRAHDPKTGSAAPAPATARKSRGAALPRITHAERVIDATTGITKGELVDYCQRAGALLLPHLQRRPVALLRAPQGVAGTVFFQKHADVSKLPGLESLDPSIDSDHQPLIGIDTLPALLHAAQMNVVEFHTWNATTRAIERPDRMVFDLDPGEGVQWPAVVDAARLVHGFLDALGLRSFLKSSGGKGLHVVVPLAPKEGWDTVKDFSQAIVQHLAAHAGERFVARSGARNRVGRVFVDYLRNGRGATTASAYSPRARPSMGISLPLDWSELPALAKVKTLPLASVRTPTTRLEQAAQAWGDYAKAGQRLTQAMKALGFTRSG